MQRGGRDPVQGAAAAVPRRPRNSGRQGTTVSRLAPRPAGLPPFFCHQAKAKAASLRADGDKLFASRAYLRALDAYDAATKALPAGAPERADLHCNKAACLYALKK